MDFVHAFDRVPQPMRMQIVEVSFATKLFANLPHDSGNRAGVWQQVAAKRGENDPNGK
jgi:hypothetical protein